MSHDGIRTEDKNGTLFHAGYMRVTSKLNDYLYNVGGFNLHSSYYRYIETSTIDASAGWKVCHRGHICFGQEANPDSLQRPQ